MISSNDLLAIPALRAKCAMRQRVLKILLQQDLPKNITAAVRERLKAEKALMGAVTAEAADREADATSGIRELVIPTYREEMQKTLPQLEKLFQGKGKIPQETAETLAKDYEAVMKQLDDPNSSLREVSGDFEKYRTDFGLEVRFRNTAEK